MNGPGSPNGLLELRREWSEKLKTKEETGNEKTRRNTEAG